MAKKRPSLTASRTRAFKKQNRRCYYCDLPMWIDDVVSFSRLHKLTIKQALLLKCTGEHLMAYHEGGATNQSNIVAACYFCNSRRHKPKKALPPDIYKKKVQRRMKAGKWHSEIFLD